MNKKTKIIYIIGHIFSLSIIIFLLTLTIMSKINQTNITEVPNDFLLTNPNTTLDKYKEYLGLSFILFLIFTCFEILIFTLALIETTNKTNKNRTLYMILVGCFSFNIFYMIGGISEYKYKEIA